MLTTDKETQVSVYDNRAQANDGIDASSETDTDPPPPSHFSQILSIIVSDNMQRFRSEKKRNG